MNAALFQQLKQSIAQFWQERDAREQRILLAAAALIVLLLVYLLLINPALTGRSQLDKTLPLQRQQAAELQVLASQAGALAQAQAASPAAPVSKESIAAALARHSLKAQSVLLTGDMVKLQLTGVSFAATVNWLDDMQRSARLVATDAHVEAQEKIDIVNATLTLRQQIGE
jgi:general secretion pathway protein M